MAEIASFELLRRLLCVLCLLTLAAVWLYSSGERSKGRKVLFWSGFLGFWLLLSGTVALHILRLPRGIPARYYANPYRQPEPDATLDRYFEAKGSGRRVDRFIDFNANDFNLHTFRGKPFSAEWQGYVYIPRDGYRVNLLSNMDSELYVDNEPASRTFEGTKVIDFGKDEPRQYMVKGWSFNERASGENPIDYVWANNDDAVLLLAVDEPVDYELQIRCYPFNYHGSQPQEMTVWVENVRLERIQLQPGWKDYRCAVPRELVQNIAPGTLRLRFTFSRVTKVSDVSDSNDERELAVAFDIVELRTQEKITQNVQSVSPRMLSKGLHRLAFTARTVLNRRSYIQLVWSEGQGKNRDIVPEDYLFADPGERGQFLQRLRLERLLLWGLSGAMVLNILLFTVWLFRYAFRPHARKLLSREVLFVALICLLAFAVRAGFILERSSFDPGFHLIPAGTDQANYVAFARGIFRGYWPGLTHAPFHFNVLNAFYLALNFILFGENLLVSRLVTAGLSSITILFTYLIARRLFQRKIAYIAALLCACNGVLIFYDTSLLISPLKTFLSVGSLWMLLKLQDEFSWRTTIGAGVFLGLNALSRATILLFMPFILLWLLWRVPATFIRKLACCVVLCLAMFMTVSPATIQNYFSNERHPFVLITSGDFGFNWWAANNPSSNGSFGYSGALYRKLNQKVKNGETTFEREVFKFIAQHPFDYVHLELKKLKLFWRGYELANLLPYYIFRHQSKILGLPWLNFVLIGPLSLVGLALALKTWRRTLLLYAFIGMQLGLLLIFWVLARYRIVSVPVLSIFAAYTIGWLFEAARQRRWGRLAITLMICAALYLSLNYPDAAHFYEQHHGEAMSFVRSFRYWDLFHTW